jgi:SAM-dependent methyltransferase
LPFFIFGWRNISAVGTIKSPNEFFMISHLPYQIDPLANRHHFYEENWKHSASKLLLQQGYSRGKLLDWGCGRGEALAIFSKMGFECRGADMDPACVELSKKFGYPVDRILSEDPRSLYPPNHFDVVVCLHVLEHVDSPKAVLSGLQHISKKFVLVGVPNARNFQEPLSRAVSLSKVNEGHLQIWDHAHLLNLAERHCGLRLIAWGFDATILPFFSRLANIPPLTPLIISLETGIFRKLFPFHGITCLGLFEKCNIHPPKGLTQLPVFS